MEKKEVVVSSLREQSFVESILKFLEKSKIKQIVYITYGPTGEERAFKKVNEVKDALKKRQAYEDVEISEMANVWRFHFSHDGSFRVQGDAKLVSEFLTSLQAAVKMRFDMHKAGDKKQNLALLELRNDEEELYFRVERGFVLMDLARKLAENLGMDTSRIRMCGFYNLPYDSESYDRLNGPQSAMQVTMSKENANFVIANPGGRANWGLRKKLIEIMYEFCEKPKGK